MCVCIVVVYVCIHVLLYVCMRMHCCVVCAIYRVCIVVVCSGSVCMHVCIVCGVVYTCVCVCSPSLPVCIRVFVNTVHCC